MAAGGVEVGVVSLAGASSATATPAAAGAMAPPGSTPASVLGPFASGDTGGEIAAQTAAVALGYALGQLGTPYRWGGEAPGVGFDCSGLVQASWAAAGVELPRVAQAQMEAGPTLSPGVGLQPGDLVFFGPEPGVATHVGMVVDPAGLMVDAQYTGAFVRVDPFPTGEGQAWGDDLYLGATRPADRTGSLPPGG